MGSSIYYLPTLPIWENKAIGTIVIGMPGSGKTFSLLNHAANCLAMGQRIIALDPKDDFGNLLNITSDIELIEIQNIREGALNPFTFLNNCDSNTLATVIQLLCGRLDSAEITAITPIIADFVKDARKANYVDLQDLTDYLYSNPNSSAMKIGSLLNQNKDSKFGKLLFTRRRDIEPLYLPKEKSFIISFFGLPMPNESKSVDDYTAEERFTSTIIYLLCKKLREVLTEKSIIPTTLFIDEAHMLFTSRDLTSVINEFLALGRSLSVAVVLASQGMSHFPANISQFIGNKFMFQSSLDEATNFINRFDVSKNDPTKAIDRTNVITAAANLKTGQCFYIDHNNRSGFVRIVSNFDISLLTSNPLEKLHKQQKQLQEMGQ